MKKLRVILSLKKSIIGNDVDVQRDFLRDLDSLVRSKKELLTKRVENLVARNPEDEQEIYDHYYEEFLTFDTRYVELSNNSQLINSYSFLEFELRGIREFLKKYLLKPKSWNKIDNYRRVRNVIVHNGEILRKFHLSHYPNSRSTAWSQITLSSTLIPLVGLSLLKIGFMLSK